MLSIRMIYFFIMPLVLLWRLRLLSMGGCLLVRGTSSVLAVRFCLTIGWIVTLIFPLTFVLSWLWLSLCTARRLLMFYRVIFPSAVRLNYWGLLSMAEFTKQEYQRFYDGAVAELAELERWYASVDNVPYSIRRYIDITVRNLIEDIQRYDGLR